MENLQRLVQICSSQSKLNSKQIPEVARILRVLSLKYYAGESTISDSVFDLLKDSLHAVQPDHPFFAEIGARPPTGSKLKKRKHAIAMGSLNKVCLATEFDHWTKGLPSTDGKYVVQEKLDGISVELEYKHGKLVTASTRGDGFVGEDITHNVVLMQNVYEILPEKDFTGSLRGEILLSLDDWRCHLQDEYANPRNTVAGMSRKKDSDVNVSLCFLLYTDIVSGSKKFKTEREKVEYAESVLLVSFVPTHVCKYQNVLAWYEHYLTEKRAQLPYEIDGLVVKLNDLVEQVAAGESNSNPAGQVAWKFPALSKQTTLLSVTWQLGRTGRLTPVAELEPVEIGGVTITRASLHNLSNLKQLGLVQCPADVLISRRNDVIPYVERLLNTNFQKQSDRSLILTQCPECGEETEIDGEFLYCSNESCSGRAKNDVKKWIEVCSMENMGDAFVDLVFERELVSDPYYLYRLTMAQLCALPGFGWKKASLVVEEIKAHSHMDLPTFFAALNIGGAGVSFFTKLADAGFDTVAKVVAATKKDLIQIPGIGDKIADVIIAGISKKKTLIEKLVGSGSKLPVVAIIALSMNGPLLGKSFCFTGALPSGMSRPVAQKLVRKCGGIVKTSVSKGLDYLVQANVNSTSSKTNKARSYGTKIIDEDEFLQMTGFNSSMLSSL